MTRREATIVSAYTGYFIGGLDDLYKYLFSSKHVAAQQSDHAKIYDCEQAYDEAAQLRSEAKAMTELVFILDRLLAILGRILGM